MNTYHVSLSSKELKDLFDELRASRRSRKSAWEKLQEIRSVIKDVIGTCLPPAKGMTIDQEGRVVKDGMSQVLGTCVLQLLTWSERLREFESTPKSY